MIINFKIRNFGSIKNEIKLSFEASSSKELEDYYIIYPGFKKLRLLKLGVIYGQNASGKTMILDGLNFLGGLVNNPLDKKTEKLNYKPFAFCDKPSPNSSFVLEFVHNQIKYKYELLFDEEVILQEKLDYYNPNKANVFKRHTDKEKKLSSIKFNKKVAISKELKKILEANTLSNNTVLGGYIKTNFESFELQQVVDWFKNTMNPLIRPNHNLSDYVTDKIQNGEIIKKNVVELLKKADFNISDFTINIRNHKISPELFELMSKAFKLPQNDETTVENERSVETKEIIFTHSFDNDCSYNLKYNEESLGTQRYYQFCGILDLMIRKKSIFMIDEIESSLHPELIEHFILTFLVNCKNSQMITTTHFRELLKDRDILRRDTIWFTDKLDDGSTDLFSLNEFDSSIVRDTSSIYNAYKIGKLGATPNLKDTYLDYENE